MSLQRPDHRRVRRNRATAQVVAVGKPAGNTDNIHALGQNRILVPDHRHIGTGILERDIHITVTVRTGELQNGSFHEGVSTGFEAMPVRI